MLAHHLFGGLVQVAGARVVAQARPVAEYVVCRCRSQCLHIRKTGHEGFEVGDNGGYLGLLKHDLRDPYPVGIAVMVPRQVVPAVLVVPCQKLVRKRVSRYLNRPLRASFTLSPSSPSFS